MDFIIGLLRTSKKHDSIIIVVDRLSEETHFIPVKTTYSASDVAQVFIREIMRFNGVTNKIVSDRDVMFTSMFWKDLFVGFGTKLAINTSHHLQTNG